MKRILLIACGLLLLASPASADYGCWPFGGTDQLIFPSCTISGGHRQVDVNVVGGGGSGLPVVIVQPATATITSVASSASSVQLLAANTSRKGYIFCNESNQVAYVAEGATATSASGGHSFALTGTGAVPYSCHEVHGIGVYTGVFNAIWAAANGAMSITEEQ